MNKLVLKGVLLDLLIGGDRTINGVYTLNGNFLSIQASASHYCFPREDRDAWKGVPHRSKWWTRVELGNVEDSNGVNIPLPQFSRYYDGDHYDPDREDWEVVRGDGIYTFVPWRLVERLVEDWGGVDVDKTFAQ